MMNKFAKLGVSLVVASFVSVSTLSAQETLKVAAGQRGNWDTSVSEIGKRAGIFKKYGLDLDILYTQGSGETQQAVISGAVDVGIAIGTIGAMAAYSKGAPIRIIGSEITGAQDLFWYVRADSPIKSLKDTEGRTISYSTNGASTHGVVNAFIAELGAKAKPVATGSPPASLTQVMSGQVDIGWAAPPFGIEQMDRKEIRFLASGNDTSFKDQTVRIVGTNVNALNTKRDALTRYMQAYRDTIEFMYTDEKALKVFADWLNISVDLAKRSRDGFFPREALNPDKINGVDKVMKEAITFKFLAAPLTEDQLKELIQIPAPIAKR